MDLIYLRLNYLCKEYVSLSWNKSVYSESATPGISFETDGKDFALFDYDMYNRVVSFTNGVTEAGYTYDGNNLRQSKMVDGISTSHIWDGANIVMETSEADVNRYYRGVNGIIYADQSGTISYYQKDAHGDTTALTDAAGIITKNYLYDAFGNEQTQDSTDINPFRYAGEYYDAESGNIYLRNRYYDASTGRFISEDPIQDGVNWYVYCGGNPVNYLDISGLEYVPLREVAEAHGYRVSYYSETRTAFIYNGGGKMIGAITDGDKQGVFIDKNDNKMYVYIEDDPVYNMLLGVPNKESGYEPPSGGGRHWDKEKKGWIDKYGNVWVKDKTNHGGEHWDVQYPNGGYDNVYNDGSVRKGKGGRGRFSPIEINVNSQDVEILDNLGEAGMIVIGAIVLYEGVKWGVAAVTAIPTGGTSLGLAALVP